MHEDTQEIWKDIPDYEDYYQASNLGRIRSVDRYVKGKWGNRAFRKGINLKPAISKIGYLRCVLANEMGKINRSVHRSVALTFIPIENTSESINHIDGNKLNNHIDNLEWCTVGDNNRHARLNKLNVAKSGKESHSYGLKNKQAHVLKNTITGEIKPIVEVANECGVTTRHITMMVKGERTNKTNYILVS